MNQDREIKQKVQQQFGQNAAAYVTSEIHAKGDDLPHLAEWMGVQDDWQVLDVATAGGHVAKALAPQCKHVVASDLTKKMLATAASHLQEADVQNATYVVADAESLPFLDGAFHGVTCRIAAHHFPHPEKFVAEAGRVLKPGGAFLLIDNVAPEDEKLAQFMNTFEKLRDESHVQCHRPSEWTAWANEYGMELEFTQSVRKTYVFPSWVARMAKTEEQQQQVERFLLDGDAATQAYFAVVVEDGRVAKLEVDEWRAVFRKK